METMELDAGRLMGFRVEGAVFVAAGEQDTLIRLDEAWKDSARTGLKCGAKGGGSDPGDTGDTGGGDTGGGDTGGGDTGDGTGNEGG